MALPTFVAAGTFSGGTGSVTPGLPAGLTAGDDMYLFVESADSASGPPTAFWRRLGFVSNTGNTRLSCYTKRAVTGETAPTVADTGDHTLAVIIAIRDGHGWPHLTVTDTGTEVGVNQVQSIDGGTTTEDDCLIIVATSHDVDVATTSYSAWTNADLANVTERADGSTSSGNGGGIGIATGELATAGTFGPTTVTNAQNNPNWAAITLAIRPTDNANDDFANAEVILPDPSDPFALLTYPGSSFDASTEVGEPLTTGVSTIDRTEWWIYEPDVRRIIKLDINGEVDPEGFYGLGYLLFRRLESGGSGVGDITFYSVKPTFANANTSSFGEDEGRGYVDQALLVGSPNDDYIRVQVAPGSTLYLQAGRYISSNGPDLEYDIEFTPLDPPANDDIENASASIVEGVDDSEAFDLMGATGQPGFKSAIVGSQVLQGDTFYQVTPASDSVISLELQKANILDNQSSVSLYAFTGDEFGNLSLIAWIVGAASGGTSSPLELELTSGQTYTFALVLSQFNQSPGNTVTDGTLSWTWPSTPANDDFANAEPISGDSGSSSVANTEGSTVETDEPGFVAKSIWYEWTPPTGGWYVFSVDNEPTNFFYSLAAYRGASLATLEVVDNNFSFASGDLALALRGGETYFIQIGLFQLTGWDFGQLNWSLLSSTQDPADDFANAQSISGASGTQAMDMEGSTNESGETPARYYNSIPTSTTWFEWVAPSTDWFTFWTEDLGDNPASSSSDLAIWHGDPFSTGEKIVGNSSGRIDLQQQVAIFATSGETYYIQTDSYREQSDSWDDPFDFILHWDIYTLTGDTFAGAVEIMAGGGSGATGTFDNFGHPAEPEITEPDLHTLWESEFGCLECGYIARPIWFKLTPDRTGTYTFTLDAPGSSGTTIQFYEGTAQNALSILIANPISDWTGPSGEAAAWFQFFGPGSPINITVDLTAGGDYYCLVTGFTYENEADADLFYGEGLWSPNETSQFEFDLNWVYEPAENDDIESQEDQTFTENQGNLSYWNPYVFNSVDQVPLNGPAISDLEGGCRVASNFGATAQVGEPSHAGGFAATRSLWFYFEPPRDGDYRIWVEAHGTNPVVDPLMAIYDWSGTIGGLGAALDSDDDTNGLYPEFTVTLQQYFPYLIAVDARDEGEFRLNWQWQPIGAPPANDDFANAITITPGTPVSGTTVDATMECGEQPSAGYVFASGGSVWYTYVATETTASFLQLTTPANTDFIYADVYAGTSLDDLVNILDADQFFHGSINETQNIPFNVTAGTTYYIRITHENGGPGTFDFEIMEQSTTPPTNDDSEDATDVPATGGGSGGNDLTSPGSTDGSGFQDGEVDPEGGLLENNEPGGGSTWHKYVAEASGFLAIWTERTGLSESNWYRIGVWEGTTRETSLAVMGGSNALGGDQQNYYEVREGQTYLIQVIRRADQTWGDYDLIINEYLETIDWELGPDNFTTEHNSVDINGGVMTCTGRQAISSARDIDPQYGTIDFDTAARKWNRGMQIHFDLRIIGGQVLYRAGTENSSWTNYSSDDHSGLYMQRVGLVRARDFDGDQVFVLSMHAKDNGENCLELNGFTGDNRVRSYTVSLGAGGSQHDSGWISVLLVVDPCYSDTADGSNPFDPLVLLRLYVDGRPTFHTTSTENLYSGYVGKAIKELDIGMWRHPSQSSADESVYEDPEIWTYEMQNIKVTNKNEQQHIDVTLRDDMGITEFDGFKSRVMWNRDSVPYGHAARHYWSVSSGSTFAITDFPDKDWGAFESVNPGIRKQIFYPHQTGSQRWYAFSFRADELPPTGTAVVLSGYDFFLGRLRVFDSGELRIMPFAVEFCVARLEAGQHYFIEVHCDYSTMWDARCRVYINGTFMGEFNEAYTWAEIASGDIGQHRCLPAEHSSYDEWYGGTLTNFSIGASTTFDFYFTNLMTGRASTEDQYGPFECEIVAAVDVEGDNHYIPEWPTDPADRFELLDIDNENIAILYDWQVEWLDSGPYNLTKVGAGHERFYPFPNAVRLYHPYYVLEPTSCWLEENAGSGNDWAPINDGHTRNSDNQPITATGGTKILKLTKFGESVPITSTFDITGIEVTVRRRGSGVSDALVQLYKGGTLTGSDMSAGGWSADWEIVTYGGDGEMWGTTWTPEEVNDDGFGIGIQATGGTAEIDSVRIRVWFTDAPGGGNRNKWGEQVVAEFYASGDASTQMHCAGFWNAEPGGTRGPTRTLSGSPEQLWGSAYPYWGFAMNEPGSVDWTGGAGGESATVQDWRAVRDPLTYPRYAWSTDDGATYTRIIDPRETDSAIISGDVGDGSDTNAIFMDNAAALDRHEHNTVTPPGSRAYRMRYYYVTYEGEAAPGEIFAANLYAKWRPFSGYPKEAVASFGTFKAAAVGADGGVTRVGTFSGSGIARYTLPRTPSGEAWTEDDFNDMSLRLGLNNTKNNNTFSIQNVYTQGAAVYAMTWELLVAATPDDPPGGCFEIVSMNWRSGNRYPTVTRVHVSR